MRHRTERLGQRHILRILIKQARAAGILILPQPQGGALRGRKDSRIPVRPGDLRQGRAEDYPRRDPRDHFIAMLAALSGSSSAKQRW
jgi:hypothetical protein